MPKCLDCGQTERFWYVETCHKLGIYNADGTLEDVETDEYEDVLTSSGQCDPCGSRNIEGPL